MKHLHPCWLGLSLCVLCMPLSVPSAHAQAPQGLLCSNSVLDEGEQCDDGNAVSGDGCSDTCQVEAGYSCTDPVAANVTNLVLDPGFEAGPFGGVWEEFSEEFDTPICGVDCAGENRSRTGSFWAWFGRITPSFEIAYLAQEIQIPATASELHFWLSLPECNRALDTLELWVDDTRVFNWFGNDAACGSEAYAEQAIDISDWSDGTVHSIQFYAETLSQGENFTSFLLDDLTLIHGPAEAVPSVCTVAQQVIFADGFESK